MDLRHLEDVPTPEECAALDTVVVAVSDDTRVMRGARGRRHLLLPGLHALHERVGWISRGGLGELCRRLDVAPADAYGVATFYGLFSTEQRPARQVHRCVDLSCQVAGVAARDGLTVPAGACLLDSPCLGLCEVAPAALVFQAGAPASEAVIPHADAAALAVALSVGPSAFGVPAVADALGERDPSADVLLARVGRVDPSSLDDFRAHGGYGALRQAIAMGPAAVIAAVSESGLVGRGGAAFPTGRKWAAVAGQPARPHYLVCNADESEPGTFKDRVLMEGDPFGLIEAMTIAGYATGCELGYIYLRGEYPQVRERLEHALSVARRRDLLGDNVMGAGFGFDIQIRRGAGAYICGEETAIFNSIEGFRGEPRSKPPFPVEVGLFGKPTLVNNVETLVNVLPIVLRGPQWYRSLGTEASPGSKLFCVSGEIGHPGVYEVRFGTTLRELLERARAHDVEAVLLGGAAGMFVTAAEFDVALTFEATRAIGATLGSGVVIALAHADIGAFLERIAKFFRDESCGQCVPCRVGTVRQHEAVVRLRAGNGDRAADLALLDDLAAVMRDASICGLGQTAPSAIMSAIAKLGAFAE